MNKSEAKAELKKGAVLTHKYFTPDEFISEKEGVIIDENGYKLHDFWKYRENEGFEDGWEFFAVNN